jgi:hypothetical protein
MLFSDTRPLLRLDVRWRWFGKKRHRTASSKDTQHNSYYQLLNTGHSDIRKTSLPSTVPNNPISHGCPSNSSRACRKTIIPTRHPNDQPKARPTHLITARSISNMPNASINPEISTCACILIHKPRPALSQSRLILLNQTRTESQMPDHQPRGNHRARQQAMIKSQHRKSLLRESVLPHKTDGVLPTLGLRAALPKSSCSCSFRRFYTGYRMEWSAQ